MEWNKEKLANRGLAILVAYAAVRSLFFAAARPFWYDELCTVILSRQPGATAMWTALQRGADSHPPPYYLVERFARSLVVNDHLAYRIPSILGFCCTVLCVFVFVRKRTNVTFALLSAIVPFLSVLYSPYAVEARGYSLMVACIAIALVCYQRADAMSWAILMGLSFAAASSFHYYAVFAIFPFALADAALFFETRRLRPAVWLATAFGVVPLILFWPLLSELKKYYGAHFASPVRLSGALAAYGWFFQLPSHWGIAMFAVVGLVVTGLTVSEVFRDGTSVPPTERLLHENVLVCGLLVLPILELAAMEATHGGLNNRYMLPSMLGFPLAIGCILPHLGRKVVVVLGAGLLIATSMQEAVFWHDHRAKMISPAVAIEQLVNAAGRPDVPILVSNAQDYLQLEYYATPDWATRFVGVVDPPRAVAYSGSDTADRQVLLLRSYIPLQVYEFHDFAATHSEFLMYSRDWWPASLLHDGYTLRLLAFRENNGVYLVRQGSGVH